VTPAHDHGSASCREMLDHLSEYLDGELDPASCAEIEGHLHDCEPCVAFLRSLRATVAHVASLPKPVLSEEARRACAEAYARHCREKRK
jgi:anti-sigma factor RsiW